MHKLEGDHIPGLLMLVGFEKASDTVAWPTLGMLFNTRCDPCTRIDENVPASKWCVDCEDALCITCVKSHKGNKVSMTHHVIDMEVISTSPHFHALRDIIEKRRSFCVIRCNFKWHEFIT
jgi:hypothetical protein